jgi:phosphoglycerate dehydrogenase-like enzyme
MAILVMSTPPPLAPYAQALREAAPDVPVWTLEDAFDRGAVEAILAWRLRPGVLPDYPALRVLCTVGAGVDKMLALPDLPPHVPVSRVVDPMQAIELAQYVVACTLQHTRQLPLYAAQQRRAQWLRHPVRPAAQCRVGILGLGRVGQAIARAFEPLGYPVAGWSRGAHRLPGVHCHAGDAELPAFLACTDILVCALPLTERTRGLLNRTTLSQLPRGACVINVGRGEQVIEPDLKALLDEGHLAAAALDVFQREPAPADDWVWLHPQVLATPHIAAQASYNVVAAQCIDALRRAREGLPQPRAADRQAGY